MRKHLTVLISISIFLLIIPEISTGENPKNIRDKMQEEKYLFSIDLIRALRYCIQSAKIGRTKSQAINEKLELSNKKIAEDENRLKEIEDRFKIAQKKLVEGSSNDVEDIILKLNRDLDSLPEAEPTDNHLLIEASYLCREKLIQARTVMEGWKDSKDKDIRKLSEDFLKGLDDLLFSSDQFLKIINKNASFDQSDDDLLSRITRSGEEEIKLSSTDLLYVISSIKTEKKPVHFYLSEKQLFSIVQNIDDIFKEEFGEKEAPFPHYAIFPLVVIQEFILQKIEGAKVRSD